MNKISKIFLILAGIFGFEIISLPVIITTIISCKYPQSCNSPTGMVGFILAIPLLTTIYYICYILFVLRYKKLSVSALVFTLLAGLSIHVLAGVGWYRYTLVQEKNTTRILYTLSNQIYNQNKP